MLAIPSRIQCMLRRNRIGFDPFCLFLLNIYYITFHFFSSIPHSSFLIQFHIFHQIKKLELTFPWSPSRYGFHRIQRILSFLRPLVLELVSKIRKKKKQNVEKNYKKSLKNLQQQPIPKHQFLQQLLRDCWRILRNGSYPWLRWFVP